MFGLKAGQMLPKGILSGAFSARRKTIKVDVEKRQKERSAELAEGLASLSTKQGGQTPKLKINPRKFDNSEVLDLSPLKRPAVAQDIDSDANKYNTVFRFKSSIVMPDGSEHIPVPVPQSAGLRHPDKAARTSPQLSDLRAMIREPSENSKPFGPRLYSHLKKPSYREQRDQ